MRRFAIVVAIVAGCGSSNTGADASPTDTQPSPDTPTGDGPPSDAPAPDTPGAETDASLADALPSTDAVISDAPPGDAPPGDTPPATQPLTVKNYLSWCSVTVDNGTPSISAQQIVNVAPGAIPLVAEARVGFQLGATPWHDTDGDSGAGDAGTRAGSGQTETSSTAATVASSPKCVWVCCEFSGGGGCPATDQCP
jgi:hypothetical protein